MVLGASQTLAIYELDVTDYLREKKFCIASGNSNPDRVKTK